MKISKKIENKIDWTTFSRGPVIGVDEVGRGCVAGPVVAAAVMFSSRETCIEGLTDSKLLSEKRREELSILISTHHQVGIGFADLAEIKKWNILKASLLAMKRAIEALGLNSGTVLVDGNQKIPDLKGFSQVTIVKGDLRCQLISAASVVAKVYRDHWMARLAQEFPHYSWEQNKGYGTKDHLAAIQKNGPCSYHREDFAGVREHWQRLQKKGEISI